MPFLTMFRFMCLPISQSGGSIARRNPRIPRATSVVRATKAKQNCFPIVTQPSPEPQTTKIQRLTALDAPLALADKSARRVFFVAVRLIANHPMETSHATDVLSVWTHVLQHRRDAQQDSRPASSRVIFLGKSPMPRGERARKSYWRKTFVVMSWHRKPSPRTRPSWKRIVAIAPE